MPINCLITGFSVDKFHILDVQIPYLLHRKLFNNYEPLKESLQEKVTCCSVSINWISSFSRL